MTCRHVDKAIISAPKVLSVEAELSLVDLLQHVGVGVLAWPQCVVSAIEVFCFRY